ncbi:hypothetical protein GUITHDRAFT_107057 [Guillardia theta CCMP2712]|uniref:C2 domain-containing protein n=1 Tax=Guillardia theta (strain CCMP2712) TaxID=905079 RepID=L1JF65_GUITC|nr:hypothetical protein GUITHDRAFT_107057 [Guillardia theta CCMP2712]EKX47146.1 hypothetical protein GUITHDRAFT_107057 [Guillardia theta CCMP2712]|eukprot:XP_005834126.1 hypothetical protein GUITHDRAFT_107057 [Guillardia theta CCMP2712]
MKRLLFGSEKALPSLAVPPIRKNDHDDDAMSYDTVSGDLTYSSDGEGQAASGSFLFSVVVLDGKRFPAGRSGRIKPRVHLQFSCPGYFSQIAATTSQSTTWPVWREGFIFSTPAENIKDISIMRHAMVMVLIEDELSNRLLGQSWVSLEEVVSQRKIDKEYHFCPTMEANPSLRLVLTAIDESCVHPSVSQYGKPIRSLRSKLGAVFHPTRTTRSGAADEMNQVDCKGTVSLLKIIDCGTYADEDD